LTERENFITSFFENNAALWSDKIVLKRNAFLIEKGQTEQYLYFILDGAVRVSYESENQEHCIRLGYKNNFINALPSFLSGKRSDLSIQALKKTIFIKVPKSTLMMHKNASLKNMQLWSEMLEDLFLQQFEREVDLLTTSPEERYKRVLKRSPMLFQEIPHKYIADYLRMTPETLSRLKKS